MLPSLAPLPNQRYMEPPKTPPTKAMRTKGKAVTHSELHRAVLRNNEDLVRRVLLRGAGPWGHANARDWWGRTPLHRACERNYIPIVLELIQRGGADVNAQETQWLRTCLHMSAERGFLELNDVLLAHGANPNLIDRQKASPLLLAVEQGNDSICEHLLEAGARVEVRNNQDMNALHIACSLGNETIVRMLLNVRKRPNNNSDVEARSTTNEGVTSPLHLAAKSGHAGCVRALLEQAADVNVKNHMGWAPLHTTAWYSNVQAAAVLMAHPTCSLVIESKEGETAYDLAKRRKRQGALKKDRIERKAVPGEYGQRNGAHLESKAKQAFSLFGQEQQIKQKQLDATMNAEKDALEKKVRAGLAFFRTAYTDRDAAIRSALHAQTMSTGLSVVVGPEIDSIVTIDNKDEGKDKVIHGELNWENNLLQIKNQIQAAVGKLMTEQKWAKSAGLDEMVELLNRAEKTCSAAMRTTAASISAMNAAIGKLKDEDDKPKGLAALLSGVNLGIEDQVDVVAAEKHWREDENLFDMACNLLVDDEYLTSNGSIAERSYHWQLNFQELWERLQSEHGWSVRSASVRERIEPGTRVEVRMSAAATLLDETLTMEERVTTLEKFVAQMGGSHNVPLEGTIRTRYKDGTYEVTFLTGDTSRILRQDMVEIEMKGDQDDSKKGELKMYDVVAVKLDSWDRWHDAEITKIHLSKDGNLMNNTYDVKLTKMNTPETDVPRLKIRKGLAPGSAGSPFYYFKPGALRQSNKCKIGQDFFGAEVKMVKHLIHQSNFSGQIAALAACRLRRDVTKLEQRLVQAEQIVSDTEASRARNLGADMLNMAFHAELKRQGKIKPENKMTKKEKEQEKKNPYQDMILTKSEVMRMIVLNPRARTLLTEGVSLLHPRLGRSLLKPDLCARLINEIDTSRDGKITVNELVEFCRNLKEFESRRILSVWVLENIFLANGAKRERMVINMNETNINVNEKNNNNMLRITTQDWIDTMQRGDFTGATRLKELKRELTRATVLKGGAIEDNDKEDEIYYTKVVNELNREFGNLADAMRIARRGAKVFDLLEQKDLMPGMMLLKDVHRYQNRLNLLNQDCQSTEKRDQKVVNANVLLDIVHQMVNEDESHDEALQALDVLFDKIDPDRSLPGRDGRVARPTLYKSLAYDPQSRALLSLVSKRASLQREDITAIPETRRQMAERVDALVALLVRDEEDNENENQNQNTKIHRTVDINLKDIPRAGYINPSEFYSSVRRMETVRRERVVETLKKSASRVVAFSSLSSLLFSGSPTWEDWKNAAKFDPKFRQIMREGGLSVTLEKVLLMEPVDLNDDEADETMKIESNIQTYLEDQALLLNDPQRSMTKAQETLKIIWNMISRASLAGEHTKNSSPKRPTPRTILISKKKWIEHFVHPETRMSITTVNQTTKEDNNNNIRLISTTESLTQEMLETLPLGLRLARQAPHAHSIALEEISTEYDGYILQDEMLSFGDRQSQGIGFQCLMTEINDEVKHLRTRQANVIRSLFDRVNGRKKKPKIPKSELLKAIAYDTKVRQLLMHVDCPPGLKLATTDPRRFRRLLSRAMTNEIDVKGELQTSKPRKSKSRDALMSQADLLAIALDIEKEESEAPQRAMLRDAGSAIRSALDLIADEGGIMGVRKDDFLLALKKRNLIEILTGEKQNVKLPENVTNLLYVTRHALDDFETARPRWVTAKELLIFTGVVKI